MLQQLIRAFFWDVGGHLVPRFGVQSSLKDLKQKTETISVYGVLYYKRVTALMLKVIVLFLGPCHFPLHINPCR